MRIDKYLFENGYAQSRQKAREIIEAGMVYVDKKQITKPSYDLDPETKEIEVTGKPYEYVSRGGVKLEGALDHFKVEVNGLVAADIGSSTGGFTDCLLRRGAKKVFAIDSGTNQLHESLRNNEKVVVMENFNARALDLESLGERVDIAVCDLSFISQKYIYIPLTKILKDGGLFVSLIKPQFEAGREYLSKNGIVKDKKIHKRVIEALVSEAAGSKLYCRGVITSPIQGGDGNVEYLALFEFSEEEDVKLGDFEMPDGI
ncbi:MAG: TlyA family RNA methyltransferase [Clostridia bacterium]|nr:TlyA family RNA methyltransferase [Clostridia bacterium]MBR3716120.1 TlyA family RNA methyltransferase [Clostridia bacterium]